MADGVSDRGSRWAVLTVRVPVEQAVEIERRARAGGVRVGDVARAVVAAGLEEKGSSVDGDDA